MGDKTSEEMGCAGSEENAGEQIVPVPEAQNSSENFAKIDEDGGGTLDFDEMKVFVAFIKKTTVSEVTEEDQAEVLGADKEKEFDAAGFDELCGKLGVDQGALAEFLAGAQ